MSICDYPLIAKDLTTGDFLVFDLEDKECVVRMSG
jgi:hypothetical protein